MKFMYSICRPSEYSQSDTDDSSDPSLTAVICVSSNVPQ